MEGQDFAGLEMMRFEAINKSELDTLARIWKAEFFGRLRKATFSYDHSRVQIEIESTLLQKDEFIRVDENSTVTLLAREVMPGDSQAIPHDYYLFKPRDLRFLGKRPRPVRIQAEELAKIVSGGKALWYTGAGISARAGVWTMDELLEKLGIQDNQLEEPLLDLAQKNSQELVGRFRYFCNSAFDGKPSSSHLLLRQICELLDQGLVSENFDHLHEKSGQKVLHADSSAFQTYFQAQGIDFLRDCNALICLGLSQDDRGLIGLFRELNPQAALVAINLSQPFYIGESDYLLQTDLHEGLSRLLVQLESMSGQT